MNMINFIESVAKVDCSAMSWNEVVDNIILPMAGPRDTRWCISDRFMDFVTDYADELFMKDSGLASILMKVALGRLSRGGVLHGKVEDCFTLPQKYMDYSSRYDEPHLLSDSCINFIMNGLEFCLMNPETKEHAQAIVLGLIKHIEPEGSRRFGYMLNRPNVVTKRIYKHMVELADKYCSFATLFDQYAKPELWEEHLDFFLKNSSNINWHLFFVKTEIGKYDNILKGWIRKRNILKKIKNGK